MPDARDNTPHHDAPHSERIAKVRARLSSAQAARWATTTEVATIEAPREALAQMIENIA